MSGGKYSIEPVDVPEINTEYRRIQTPLPVPESVPILEKLRRVEPRSMQGQPPIIWHRAEGFNVEDRWGNRWIDWSSCVLVSNAGHGHPRIQKAIRDLSDRPLLATYVFPHETRADLAEKLVDVAPEAIEKAFILSTGSEATECAIKLARTHGVRMAGEQKHVIVTFENAFHGRTLGAQLAGGMEKLKDWIVHTDVGFVQVPFPDGFKTEDRHFELFEESLAQQGVDPDDVAGVMTESYQGVGPDFLPAPYAQSLREWCDQHEAVLIMDEVQSGFGRTGKMFCFEHYDIVPDLICCGKGVSSSLPISAVLGTAELMDQYAPGSMTSTHSGNPVCCAAALAGIEALEDENLIENAATLGPILRKGLEEIQTRHPDHVGCVQARGLVAGLQMVEPGSKTPNSELALRINEKCFQKGLLMFAPVGVGGECVKIAPPLCITEDALHESLAVLAEAADEAVPAV
ncbi:MAG: aspartate aminotransferase family protein [Planctomycetes bacterium]|nr:aspartate aminotransferase family protein [Planctomycetota bacterium]